MAMVRRFGACAARPRTSAKTRSELLGRALAVAPRRDQVEGRIEDQNSSHQAVDVLDDADVCDVCRKRGGAATRAERDTGA